MRAWKNIIKIGCFLSLLTCSWAFAQQLYDDYNPQKYIVLPVPERTGPHHKQLTLREAIFLALRTNPDVRSAEIQRISDKFALEVAHNKYMPQYTLGATTTWAPGSRPQYAFTPTGSLLTPLGTQIEASYNGTYLGGAGNGSSVTTKITQPLLQGFGPKVTMAPLAQAEWAEHSARLNLKNTVMSTITAVIQSYYTVVQDQNNLKVAQDALKNSMETLEQGKIKVKAGQMAALELAPLETQVANQQLLITQNQNAIQRDYQALLIVLGLDPESKLDIDPNIDVEITQIPDYTVSKDLALQNNIQYLQALYQLKQDQVQTFLARDQQRWQLDLTATKVVTPNSNSGASIGNIGGSAPSGDSVALNLNIPIDNKALQQQLVTAQVQLQQQKIAVHQAQLTTASTVWSNRQTLVLQLQQIQQAQEAVRLAQQALNVEKIKLAYGRSTVLSVTQLQTTLTQAQLDLISQQIQYINDLAQFEQTLGTTLDKWGVRIYY